MIIHGDCIKELKKLPDNSVDSICTDPPYELGFMGKSWDNTGIANNMEMWKECLRVLKPGGHLLSFSGTRTYHRMVVAIEDAGFEVRDMIEWVYGSGFPKSLNIGKAVDKTGNKIKELKNFTKWFDDICKEKNITNKQLDEYLGLKSGGATCSHYRGWNTEQPRYPREEHFKKLKEWLGFGDLWAGLRAVPQPSHSEVPLVTFHSPYPETGISPLLPQFLSLPEKTVAENCLKYGTGGINIDISRIPAYIDGDNSENIVLSHKLSELRGKKRRR